MIVGLSSTCFPRLTSAELIDRVKSLNVIDVDLAAGRGQSWELDDPTGITYLRRGISVVLVGIRAELGDPNLTPEVLASLASPYAGHCLRLFLAEGSGHKSRIDSVKEQLSALTDIGFDLRQILVDTHQGHATTEDFVSVLSHIDLGVVADNEGLSFMTNDAPAFLRDIGPAVRVLHLKSFRRITNSFSTENVSITGPDVKPLSMLIGNVPQDAKILLQSRSETTSSDLKMLQKAAREAGRS